MKCLVFNAGSSTVKYRLVDAAREESICGGVVERIGDSETRAMHWLVSAGGSREEIPCQAGDTGCVGVDHAGAFDLILAHLAALWSGSCVPRPEALAHRVVHGGERFSGPTLIDDSVISVLEALQSLAPLHNPPALSLICASLQRFPQLPQVAVFDTAFHQSLPAAVYRYAVPESWYSELGLRRYGFHGISHEFVAGRAAEQLGRPLSELRLIVLHLGNGASVAAIDRGRSVETSMGMTPLEGLVMGTRSGDIDPAAVLHAGRMLGLDSAALERQLTRESGLKGLCGDTDMREIVAREQQGDPSARLALDVYTHRLHKYIGAYHAVLGGLDGLVFTAGVGEHAVAIRARVCSGLEHLGIRLNQDLNAATVGQDGAIHQDTASVAILVTCTDEERAMAAQAYACCNSATTDRQQ